MKKVKILTPQDELHERILDYWHNRICEVIKEEPSGVIKVRSEDGTIAKFYKYEYEEV